MKIFTIILIVFLFLGCNNPEPSQMSQFKGLWKMYTHEITDDNGNWIEHNWMKDGVGYIIYDGEGHMVVHITPKNYANKKMNWNNEADSLNLNSFRPEFEMFLIKDDRSTIANYVYVSNCKILDGNIIEHSRLSHGNPEKFNEVVQRAFEFKGDTLILSPLNLEGQNQRRIKWIKQ